ncbi:MAG: hypothetical protein OEN01_03605 [Candidatus Krumholzibacteria bacterium]|nr:hypothetical protein [Candidatus Krumholzibacteria bacterium]
MKKLSQMLLVLASLSLVAVGCSRLDAPQLPLTHQQVPEASLNAPQFVVLDGYSVQYDGRVFANNQTTFAYTITRSDAEQIGFFALQIPDCASELLAYSPGGASVHVNPATGRMSVKWAFSLPAGESETFAYTFAGEVEEGLIFAWVKASPSGEEGVLGGPCGGFVISGNVFVDADSSGAQNDPESGIVNVTVELVDTGNSVEAATTDASGYYSFKRLDGTYTVRLPLVTAADDFNEELDESFDPTTALSYEVTVGPDSPGNDFGFEPTTEDIILDFEIGELTTLGEPVRFWKRQLRTAIRGGSNATFDATAMAAFIDEIEALLVTSPFQFTPGSEFEEALTILSMNSRGELGDLRKELLAAEFNWFAGFRMNDEALQLTLLAWGEALVAENTPAAASDPKGEELPPSMAPRGGDTGLSEAIGVFDLMNGGGGGGAGGGGEN